MASDQPSAGFGAAFCVVVGTVLALVGLAGGAFGVITKNISKTAVVAAAFAFVLGTLMLWLGLAMDEGAEDASHAPTE